MIEEIPHEFMERLAIHEHEEWMQERLASGCTYGEVKNTSEKTSPYFVPYDELSKTVKDQDRDVVRSHPRAADQNRDGDISKNKISNK